jgi:hypothetical protein
MTPEQIEALADALNDLPRRDHPYVEVFSDYRDPPHQRGEIIIQLDGDFTVDELRQIVAACDAAMGTQQVVETVTQHIVFHDQGYERRTTKTTPLEQNP